MCFKVREKWLWQAIFLTNRLPKKLKFFLSPAGLIKRMPNSFNCSSVTTAGALTNGHAADCVFEKAITSRIVQFGYLIGI
jgi:hypothetical protein